LRAGLYDTGEKGGEQMAFLPPIQWNRNGDEMTQLKNYVLSLEEQVRYVLANLGGENMAAGGVSAEDLAPTLKTEIIETKNSAAKNALAIKKSSKSLELLATKEELRDGSVTKLNNTAVLIDAEEGVKVKTTGNFEVESGGKVQIDADEGESYIRFGGTKEEPNFMLGRGGNVIANSGNFKALSVENAEMVSAPTDTGTAKIFVGETQPSGMSNYLWIKPVNSGPVVKADYYGTPVNTNLSGTTASQTVTVQRTGSALSASQVSYGVKFRIYNFGGTDTYSKVRVTLKRADDTGNEVNIFEQNMGWVYVGDYVSIDTLASPATGLENLTDAAAIKVKIYVEKATGVQARLPNAEITLQCSAQSASGSEVCEVRWVK